MNIVWTCRHPKTGTIITVFGDESFSRKFYEYRHSLEINGFGDYFKDLDNSIEIYTIKEGWLVDDNYFNLKTKTIKWDPNHIYISSNNIALSPAITLIHEIGHAYHYEQYGKKRDISTFLEHIRQFGSVSSSVSGAGLAESLDLQI